MFSYILKSIFGSKNDRALKKYSSTLFEINALELDFVKLSDSELKDKFFLLKKNFKEKDVFKIILPQTYAIVREVSRRFLKLRHYDVQILSGIALYDNKIIEVATGEGKTLIATLPVCLLSFFEKTIHVVTVNDYLAKRDAEWMFPIYDFLEISIGVLTSGMSIIDRKNAYKCNVVYGTCSEFGFDYLRDNIVLYKEDKVQPELFYALLDEVDSILIDEARTPLIISSPDKSESVLYIRINNISKSLSKTEDLILDEKHKQVQLTELGFSKLEFLLKKNGLIKSCDVLYDISNINLLHDVYSALKAIYFFKKDVDYIVQDDSILIVDENTGRIMDGRRWGDGIHQAIEAKEGVSIKNENQVLASITFQNYFRLYNFLSGMTGTAYTEAQEFSSIYNLEVIIIPTNKPCIRIDQPDLIFINKKFKFDAVLDDIKRSYKLGQPILVGTVSISVSEFLSDALSKNNIKHNVLNAKQHEKESQIIADAGKLKSVTIATNMAGRGTDIVLGGKKFSFDQSSCVINLGGLRVIGTERHEARRIDNQLRGRCGRQGDPGCTQFYLSLEDDLVRIFVGDKISFLLNKLKISGCDAISHNLITKSIENSQRRVEAHNFDIRKQLLEFDDIFNEQRNVFYNYRNFLIYSDNVSNIICSLFDEIIYFFLNKIEVDETSFDSLKLVDSFNLEFNSSIIFSDNIVSSFSELKECFASELKLLYFEKKSIFDKELFLNFEKILFLNVLDINWKEHLLNLDYLKKGIHLRGYANQDPKQEYKREAFLLFENMLSSAKYEFFLLFLKFPLTSITSNKSVEKNFTLDNLLFSHANNNYSKKKIGRNSLCYCGSGKKYKQCHEKVDY